ncbi:hypothetical protein B0H19DRAFT_1375583 [Mycena capillaripes]|nr:hypothetical protein B0H19DRAFT_1375583 [Mycena capillaripes]
MPETFILPDFLANFEHEAGDQPNLSLNPNFAAADKLFLDWYQTKATEWPAAYHQMWFNAQIPLCTAYQCPRASLYHLGFLNSNYTMESMFEGMTDTTSYASGDFDINILCPVDGPSLMLAEKSEDPIIKVIAELAGTWTAKVPAPYAKALIPHLKDVVQKMLDEFWDDTLLRSHEMGSRSSPGHEIFTSGPVHRMTLAASELVALTNDLCSYKETRDGEALHNAVTVCMLNPAIDVVAGDVQAAVDFVATHAMREFRDATAAIEMWPGHSKSLVEDADIDNTAQIPLYADVLMEAIMGDCFWHVDPRTVRYSVFDDAESRKARRVTMF